MQYRKAIVTSEAIVIRLNQLFSDMPKPIKDNRELNTISESPHIPHTIQNISIFIYLKE
jgi:nitrate reductase cytochrome c-type subunit